MIFLFLVAQLADVQAGNYFPMYEGQSARTRNLVQPYFECSFNAAGKFERSGDGPTEVVKAAMAYCDEARGSLNASVDVDLAMTTQLVPPGTADKVMSRLDMWIENHLRMRVVAKRAMKVK